MLNFGKFIPCFQKKNIMIKDDSILDIIFPCFKTEIENEDSYSEEDPTSEKQQNIKIHSMKVYFKFIFQMKITTNNTKKIDPLKQINPCSVSLIKLKLSLKNILKNVGCH